MGRKRREWIPGHFYHIGARGNRRDPLFKDPSDFNTMFHVLENVYQKTPFHLISYCFMTNHYHLLMRSHTDPLSKIMANVNKRYASYYNNKYNLTGHVFEKRFFAGHIKSLPNLLGVSRYIHRNPVEAKMVRTPKEYYWTSFWYYSTPACTPPKYIDTDHLLTYYPGTNEEKRRQYLDWCEEELDEEERLLWENNRTRKKHRKGDKRV
ncbi:transposase [Evansella tamaricis]|uniref:transposase n=1 Tax=Evansella tamaricis TaxID=2069301 RepID=UPI001FE44F00|nr:transposase [Evansella tamaricis]